MGELTYKGKSFYMDGEPYVIISGAMHYFRIPREYWYDRLLKLKECGFNTVETYMVWNLHEPREGVFDFSGMLDFEAYIDMAASLGLNVILRPGPYICAEWEAGGFPAWLLRYRDMKLRCMDPLYLSKLRNYLDVILPMIRPHLQKNGGNVIMLQVENEYGSFGDDKEYLSALVDIYKENQMDCLYFTSDGEAKSMLTGGAIDGYLSVANFGSDPEYRASIMFERFPDQPFMCGEYWNGWFDHWGEEHHVREVDDVGREFKIFMDNDWSVNVYMFHGGTNFGFMNGANYFEKYDPTVTSYDYHALLSEAGDRTAAYYRFREILVEKLGDKVPALTARESEKKAYGKLKLTHKALLFDNLDNISAPIHSPTPLFMEDVGQSCGFILYRSMIKGSRDDWPLYLDAVHDRAGVFVDGERQATYMRSERISDSERVRIPLKRGESAILDILCENMGRVNYGPKFFDRKGIDSVRFGNQFHFGWDIYPLPMEELSGLNFVRYGGERIDSPVFLRGSLNIEGEPCDTFLRTDGFCRGFVKVNGINVGRFDKIGPTKTLYIPAPFLKEGENEILVFDSDGVECTAVELCDAPDLG